jgi:hypothetical protein
MKIINSNMIIAIIAIIGLGACHSEKSVSNIDEKTEPDTSRHEVDWQVYDFGHYPRSSVFRDVAIIDENNIWVVGSIYTENVHEYDSLGNFIKPYNAAHWNGYEWSLERIFWDDDYAELTTVFAFSEDDIWFGVTNFLHWNGSTYEKKFVSDGAYFGRQKRMWGTSPDNFYIVGYNGGIAHFDGTDWRRFESGTSIQLLDVWGSPDGSVVWTAGFDDVLGSILLCNKGNGFEQVARIDSPSYPVLPNVISHIFRSGWTDNADTMYLASVGRIYSVPTGYSDYAPENIWFDYDNEVGYPNQIHAIRGTSKNDLFIAGFQNKVLHFNGKSWKTYEELKSNIGIWYALDVNSDIVLVAGASANNLARVAIGFRN